MIRGIHPYHSIDDGGRVKQLVEEMDRRLPDFCDNLTEETLFGLAWELKFIVSSRLIQGDYKITDKGKKFISGVEGGK